MILQARQPVQGTTNNRLRSDSTSPERIAIRYTCLADCQFHLTTIFPLKNGIDIKKHAKRCNFPIRWINAPYMQKLAPIDRRLVTTTIVNFAPNDNPPTEF